MGKNVGKSDGSANVSLSPLNIEGALKGLLAVKSDDAESQQGENPENPESGVGVDGRTDSHRSG